VESNVNARNQHCQIASNQAIFFPPYDGLCNTGEEHAFPPSEPNFGSHPAMAEGYYVFIKPLPVGTHKIELEVLRNPQEPNQPVEYPIVKYTINVIPAK